MAERWLALLNGLTQRLLEDPGLFDEPGEILEEFVDQGYQPKEVESALAWIDRFIAGPDQVSEWTAEPITSRGLRTRSTEEHISFSPEAFGFLLRLENSGIIDPSLREEILERALGTYDEEIGEEEIRTVSRMVLQDHGVAYPDNLSASPGEADKSRSRNLH
jgi:Smg protein